MASFASTQSTQPFSDASTPSFELQQLISNLPRTNEIGFVRIFARCCLHKRFLSVYTFPDKTLAKSLDHNVLAVIPSTDSTGCELQVPDLDQGHSGTHLRLYFDPVGDGITAKNLRSGGAVTLRSVTSTVDVPSGQYTYLTSGAWVVSTALRGDTPVDLVDLYVQPGLKNTPPNGLTLPGQSGSKRRQGEAATSAKKQKAVAGSHHVVSSAVSHPILELSDGETLLILGQDRKDNYQLTREKLLAATPAATLFTAKHSERPGQVILTKVLKVNHGAHLTAEQWQQEKSVHEIVSSHVGRSL